MQIGKFPVNLKMNKWPRKNKNWRKDSKMYLANWGQTRNSNRKKVGTM